jgi:pimeloyl-ACP methyl ester carboxylesterase
MKITTETFFVDASDPGIKLHVRNKHLSGEKVFQPDKIVLFVHGASYPAETTFDIALLGGSWMDYAAERGYDTYLVDIRGYGHSTRPASMDVPPDQNQPFATTADATKDVGSAVDFILKRRKVDRSILLVGPGVRRSRAASPLRTTTRSSNSCSTPRSGRLKSLRLFPAAAHID